MKRSALLLALSLAAPAAFAENLLDVYRLAQTNGPAWARELAAHQANIEKGPQGRALLMPSVLFNASAAKLDQDSKTAIINDSSRYRSDTYSVQLTQPLFTSKFRGLRPRPLGVSQAEPSWRSRAGPDPARGRHYFDAGRARRATTPPPRNRRSPGNWRSPAIQRRQNLVARGQARRPGARPEIVADIDLNSNRSADPDHPRHAGRARQTRGAAATRIAAAGRSGKMDGRGPGPKRADQGQGRGARNRPPGDREKPRRPLPDARSGRQP